VCAASPRDLPSVHCGIPSGSPASRATTCQGHRPSGEHCLFTLHDRHSVSGKATRVGDRAFPTRAVGAVKLSRPLPLGANPPRTTSTERGASHFRPFFRHHDKTRRREMRSRTTSRGPPLQIVGALHAPTASLSISHHFRCFPAYGGDVSPMPLRAYLNATPTSARTAHLPCRIVASMDIRAGALLADVSLIQMAKIDLVGS
jgi:hypothetical protein